ncbi:serine hydrolase domain-containing protein [Paractinoplanes atraurantiacus]|uniref:CubicO group peptidase, beta-lactamase class C family n=1 Tax=Paractinoplanes atraurantiacus TaxID=1036182 RepID=A0A285JXJ5_9ACTN|nr:serine hydrolase domain-containing protein [Actinoplanes atraurantiacus]SNY65035.1 CubicO group peptidase, beta-lactamase class C family [Actinoplanes atraurantiacus]
MTDLGSLAQQTADDLARTRAGVVVAVLSGDDSEIRSAGRVTADDVFEIGSITKVFTALTLARMTVDGSVSLGEPLAGLLPSGASVPSRDGVQITLQHLATHTAGLPRLPTGMLKRLLLHPNDPDPYARCTTDMLLAALARTRLAAPPGKRFRYSNFGAGLLGLALARRAGTPYTQLVLEKTGLPQPDPSLLVQGHTRRGRETPPWHLADLAGAGALHSTAADLLAFLRRQLDDPDDPAIHLTRSVKHQINPFTWVHLGWMGRRLHARLGSQTQLWHNGGTSGFTSFAGFDPEHRTAVVLLSSTQRLMDKEAGDLLRALSA